MFLSGEQIDENNGSFFPDAGTYEPRNVKQACYDLRIGDEVLLSEQRVPHPLSEDDPFVLLPPGQFALIKTYEQVAVPREYVAFISIRSTFKFQGLINISGFHVDPTYEGHLIFAVQNVGPNDIRLKFKEPAFMIMWAKLLSPYAGKDRKRGYDRIPLELMAQLGGPSVTIESLERRVRELSLSMKIYGGFAIGASIAVFALLIRILLGRG